MTIEVIPADRLSTADRAEIVALCSLAYEEDFAPYLDLLPGALHLLVRDGGAIVSHLCLVTRWLQPAGMPLLCTAYVEAVATAPAFEGRGHATRLLAAIPPLVTAFDIAALSPSDPGFYARLGWELWHGPLAVRTDAGPEPSPDEIVMVLRLPKTPPLNIAAPLSIEYRPGEAW